MFSLFIFYSKKNQKKAIQQGITKNEINLNINPKVTILESINEQQLYDNLTCLEVESFVSILSIEYVNWKGKNKEINCPNLAKSADKFNRISNWMIKQIFSCEDKLCASIIELLIKTMRVKNFILHFYFYIFLHFFFTFLLCFFVEIFL